MDSILFFLDPDGMGRKESIGQARFTGLTGFFSPSARSPFGRRPFYPDDPVDPVQFSFKDDNLFLFLPYFDLRFFYSFFFDQTGRFFDQRRRSFVSFLGLGLMPSPVSSTTDSSDAKNPPTFAFYPFNGLNILI